MKKIPGKHATGLTAQLSAKLADGAKHGAGNELVGLLAVRQMAVGQLIVFPAGRIVEVIISSMEINHLHFHQELANNNLQVWITRVCKSSH